uniref:BZIP domain-containing protein n=1 Tax=Loa loa TaxID=7209 RepID=A0A1I7W2C7_LOALO
MTSGHFLSSAVVHHPYHPNHQYQYYKQQEHQEQYHHHFPTLSTIIPAVSRLHSLPHHHIIIRRAILPQWQHSSPANDHHQPFPSPTITITTTPTDTLTKKIDMIQIDEELKALKKKRKRLRQLREEVRKLSDHLKSKRIFAKSKLLNCLSYLKYILLKNANDFTKF